MLKTITITGWSSITRCGAENIPGSKNVPKTVKIIIASSRIPETVDGTRLRAKIAVIMMDNARSVRMNRCTDPYNGREIIDTTTDGIENTRVAMRKPRIKLFDGVVLVLVRPSTPPTKARGDVTMITRGSMSNAASTVESTFNNSNDLDLAFLDAGGGVPAIKEADKGTVMAVVHAKA